jgi:hypothetical protein
MRQQDLSLKILPNDMQYERVASGQLASFALKMASNVGPERAIDFAEDTRTFIVS